MSTAEFSLRPQDAEQSAGLPDARAPESAERPRGGLPDARAPESAERPRGGLPDARAPESAERPRGGLPDARAPESAEPSGAEQLRLYERMLLIRRTEERLSADSAAGKLPGAVHLYIGEEAVAAGVCAHLEDRDYVTSTHRGHGHYLAKGGDLNAMMAEIWGKRQGICRGMGGSMHVADIAKGILGANGIVGAGLAIAAGAAFGARLDSDGKVAVCFSVMAHRTRAC